MREWRFKGIIVRTPSQAEIPYYYQLGQKWDDCVQQTLHKTSGWQGSVHESVGVTGTIRNLSVAVPKLIVPTDNLQVIWAEHSMHRGKDVGLSPFVFCKEELTRVFTVVLADTLLKPRLLRAFPGEFVPLLPWQYHSTRKKAEESRAFWKKHAYVCVARAIREGTVHSQQPDWYS